MIKHVFWDVVNFVNLFEDVYFWNKNCNIIKLTISYILNFQGQIRK